MAHRIISARGLERSHQAEGRTTKILRGVDLDLERGEFLCVMGPSGSGKTTLLHILAGLDTPTKGTVELEGQALNALSPKQLTLARRRSIAQVFQFFNLMPSLSVFENVGLPLAIAGHDPEAQRDRLEGILARLGLAARRDALPYQLSGGEMQRTSIARALAGGQPLMLCDEPTGNLSQQAGLEVMKLLQRLRREDGKTILLVTHNPRDAAFADRVLFLVDGVIDPDLVLHGPGIPVERVHEALAALAI
ncbi:MAG: ABC transporter ATP-binding protein [Planctomycetes bacterium]|nr:ABC transporter ATP-binding protein [Planctomycetota bacterium]